jgi:cell wall-associated NlpC family hydrolase
MTIAKRAIFELHGTTIALDPRVHAVRGDLADIALAGQIFVPHYARPMAMRCILPAAMLRREANEESEAISQLLHGEEFLAVDLSGGWVWGYCRHDHYVGYLPQSALCEGDDQATDSVVTVREALVFADPDDHSRSVATLPMGARLNAVAEGDFVKSALGYVSRKAVDAHFSDAVAVAETLLDVPYVWGGRSGTGIDCSGLVQLSLALTGRTAPRDTDQQQAKLGENIPAGSPLERGDMIFLPGHVGMMTDGENLIHANVFHGKTVVEPLSDVEVRYAAAHDGIGITARKRIAP